MATAPAGGTTVQEPPILWKTFPSWAQFTWLYLLAALTSLRGALFFRFGIPGWEWWIVGGVLLIVCAAILRRWAHYELTMDHVTMRNGYTGREIQSLPLSDVGKVTVRQGMVAGFFDIGTLAVQSKHADRLLMLRGIADPDHIKTRIEALAWKHQPGNQVSESGPAQSGDL
jgi:hypothetical protein